MKKKKQVKAKREQESNITFVQEHYHVMVVLKGWRFTVAFGPNRNKGNELIEEICGNVGKGKPFVFHYLSFPSGDTNSICINPMLFAGAYLARETIRTKIDLDVRVVERDPKPETRQEKKKQVKGHK